MVCWTSCRRGFCCGPKPRARSTPACCANSSIACIAIVITSTAASARDGTPPTTTRWIEISKRSPGRFALSCATPLLRKKRDRSRPIRRANPRDDSLPLSGQRQRDDRVGMGSPNAIGAVLICHHARHGGEAAITRGSLLLLWGRGSPQPTSELMEAPAKPPASRAEQRAKGKDVHQGNQDQQEDSPVYRGALLACRC
jgi:hypothetical protein